MSSKFKGVFANREREAQPLADTPELAVREPVEAAPSVKPVGRPKTGKRSSPDYEQVTAYIKKQTYKDIRIALLQNGGEQEFSDLVEELLHQWLEART